MNNNFDPGTKAEEVKEELPMTPGTEGESINTDEKAAEASADSEEGGAQG